MASVDSSRLHKWGKSFLPCGAECRRTSWSRNIRWRYNRIPYQWRCDYYSDYMFDCICNFALIRKGNETRSGRKYEEMPSMCRDDKTRCKEMSFLWSYLDIKGD